MSTLTPQLFTLRYDDLVQLGRSRLPGFSPDWTDHNAHDPGITLMELLAWVAEAQLYSLDHLSRDERTAYAALLDVSAAGTRAARGLLWPDHLDPASPSNTFLSNVVIDPGASIHLPGDEELQFRPEYKVLWTPGNILRLWSRAADGADRELASINRRGGAEFLPFGETAGPRDIFAMEFETRADEGLFPPPPEDASGAFWIIGVRALDLSPQPSDEASQDLRPGGLAVDLVAGTDRYSLPIAADSSNAMMRTGALVLDLSGVKGSPKRFTIEFRAPRGLPRAPRVLRIEPNVLPITQRRTIEAESHDATGLPDQSFDCAEPGLCFRPGEEPVQVAVSNGSTSETWTRCEGLSDEGPGDRAYELDEGAGRVRFGNGHNGAKPAADSKVLLSYGVSDGEKGNVARNRKWIVTGVAGVFGVNPDPISGGAGRLDLSGLRREARSRAPENHALVSSADIEDAAKSLPLLEVARAWVPASRQDAPRTGTVTLTAMRSRPGGIEPAQPPETRRWLEAIRRRLAGRLPLGTNLLVVAPRYVDFIVRTQLQVQRGRNPEDVKTDVRRALKSKLALVASEAGTSPREPGVPVTSRDVTAWIRSVDGVGDVLKLELVVGQDVKSEVAVPKGGLPRLDLDGSDISAKRAAPGSSA
jgi:predicted phage baseplate assembly protein